MHDRVPDLFAAHGLAGARELSFEHDGWSGSTLTRLERGGRRWVLKRTSWERDWIVRATDDRRLREAWVAGRRLDLPSGVVAPYLGAARDGDGAAVLMPDLSAELISWSDAAEPVSIEVLDRILRALTTLHRGSWWPADPSPPWCPLDRRLRLLTRTSAERYRADGLAAGERFVAGWDAFERQAPAAARELVSRLDQGIGPLVAALERLPSLGLHGDLKLGNVALLGDREIALIDWQMTLRAPVAVELGWLLVSNVALLPEPPDAVLRRYHDALQPFDAAKADLLGDWDAQVDLASIVGLLLRGWRKGLDAEAGIPTGWGATGADDLAWWCRRAVEAADRRL